MGKYPLMLLSFKIACFKKVLWRRLGKEPEMVQAAMSKVDSATRLERQAGSEPDRTLVPRLRT